MEDGNDLAIGGTFSVLSLDCSKELSMGRVMSKHVDHVVEANEEVTDGNSIYFIIVESSPADQMPNTINSVPSDLHPVSMRRCVCLWKDEKKIDEKKLL